MDESPKLINVGLFGFGVVGQGVWKNIEKNRTTLEGRLGVRICISRIVVRDLMQKRTVVVPNDILTTDPNLILNDPDIDIVCELIGGTDLALKLTESALKKGKIVVTANKALICEHGEYLFDLAKNSGSHYFYEASVAGGIPIIKTIQESLVGNHFSLIFGILNGTSNYILTRMEREGSSFDSILVDARKLGYVESDEALDLDGFDAAHKVIILTYLAHGFWVKLKDITCEGIRKISQVDIEMARHLGYRIKLLGIISKDLSDDALTVRLHPALISSKELIADVNEVYNGISVTGDVVGTTLFVGRGAGQDATSSSVISDISDAVSMLGNRNSKIQNVSPIKDFKNQKGLKLKTKEELESRYYVRFHVKDKEGVLAESSNVFAEHHISFATVNQKELEDNFALIMVTTHRINEASIIKACSEVEVLNEINMKPYFIRIFNPSEFLS